jgi:uncharacterized protein YndB with AHSA1/START domain
MTAAVIDESIEIAAPVDRVWECIATSEGLSAWFVEADVSPGPDGSVTLRFGPGMEATMPIQAWEPERRLRFGSPEGGEGRSHELSITSVPAGVRVDLCDAGLPANELEATRHGWRAFLTRLKSQAEG